MQFPTIFRSIWVMQYFQSKHILYQLPSLFILAILYQILYLYVKKIKEQWMILSKDRFIWYVSCKTYASNNSIWFFTNYVVTKRVVSQISLLNTISIFISVIDRILTRYQRNILHFKKTYIYNQYFSELLREIGHFDFS